ncbi:hypothetical protein EJB05_52533, partial [Eragrostis curvula]
MSEGHLYQYQTQFFDVSRSPSSVLQVELKGCSCARDFIIEQRINVIFSTFYRTNKITTYPLQSPSEKVQLANQQFFCLVPQPDALDY